MSDESGFRDFLVPDLGEGLLDATVTSWSVEVGDSVDLNQTLCTVETNKAEVEIPSPFAGRIVQLGGAEGETLAVGTLLVRIDTGISDAPELRPQSQRQPEPPTPTRTPVLVGYGTDETMDVSRRPRAAPKVRKLAADLAVDLGALHPVSGNGGIITRQEVVDAARSASPDASLGETIPVRGVRARMATQMSLSRNTIPDAHASVQVDCSALLSLRDQLSEITGVTPFVLTLRLLSIALSRHRVLNSTWISTPAGAEIRVHRDVRLGVAVATDRGLVVPVIDAAQRQTIRQLAGAVEELVGKARAGSLLPTQLGGSTFTVSNFGALGLDEGVPVINHPEAAILGMGSLKPRAVVVDGEVVARPTMTLTVAFDHRILDGAQAAAFLTDLRSLIQSPARALLDL